MKKILLIAAFLLFSFAAQASDDLSVHSDGKPMGGDSNLSAHPNPNAAPADLPRDPNSRSNDPVPNYYPYQDYEYNHGNHPPGGQPGAPPIQGPQGNQHGGMEHSDHHHDLSHSTSGHHHDMDHTSTGHHDHDHDMDHTSSGHHHDMDHTSTGHHDHDHDMDHTSSGHHDHDMDHSTTGHDHWHDHDMDDSTTGHHDHDHDMDHTTT